MNYNINSVVRITGLTAFVIRAWEKRYNVVTPTRTATNRRIYTENDVEKLRLLKQAVDNGNSIRNIAGLSTSELKELITFKEPGKIEASADEISTPDDYLQKCLTAIKELDYHRLEKYLFRSSIEFSHPVIIENIILPLLKEIGICWHQGSLRVAQEHMASVVIRTFLYNLRDAYKTPPGAPKILITTPVGQQHEFGALAAALVASFEGWDSVYLGPDLPASEIIAAAEQIKPAMVALSIIFISDDYQLIRELQSLQHLPDYIKFVAGGAGSVLYKEVIEKNNGTVLPDFDAFREYLRKSGV